VYYEAGRFEHGWGRLALCTKAWCLNLGIDRRPRAAANFNGTKMNLQIHGIHVAAKRDDFLVAMVNNDDQPTPYVVFRKCGTDVAAELGVSPGSIYFEFGDELFGGYDLLRTVNIESAKSWRITLSAAAVAMGLPPELHINYVGTESLGLRVPAAFKKIGEVLSAR